MPTRFFLARWRPNRAHSDEHKRCEQGKPERQVEQAEGYDYKNYNNV